MLVKSSTGTGLAGMNYEEWIDTRKEFYRDSPLALKEGTSHLLGLFPDDEFQSFDPNRPNAAFQPFLDAAFQQIGNALELPHEVLSRPFAAPIPRPAPPCCRPAPSSPAARPGWSVTSASPSTPPSSTSRWPSAAWPLRVRRIDETKLPRLRKIFVCLQGAQRGA